MSGQPPPASGEESLFEEYFEEFFEDYDPSSSSPTWLDSPSDGGGGWYVYDPGPPGLIFIEARFYEQECRPDEFDEDVAPKPGKPKFCELFGPPCNGCPVAGFFCAPAG